MLKKTLVVAVAASLAVPGTASAHTYTYSPSITAKAEMHGIGLTNCVGPAIEPSNYPCRTYYVTGRIASYQPDCFRYRVVGIYNTRSGKTRPVRGTDTDYSGRYEAEPWFGRGVPLGKYYARVEARRFVRAGHNHLCSAAQSPPVSWVPAT